ncbi:MAG: SIMPL domain-containing protein [Phycisphaerae bacterium]|nr:SIMPL domain-containing protein [Phycisphaerae bacterium]
MKGPTAGAVLVICFLLAPMLASAEEKAEPRLVTVTGTARVEVAPDEVVLTVGVETIDNDVSTAAATNDKRVKDVFSLAHEHGVADPDVQTDRVSLGPEYEYRETDGERRYVLVGYKATQTIAITLRDITKYETLLTGLLKAGVNRVDSVEFRTSEPRKHKDQARIMAVKAAREKAEALAGALGQQVGIPHSIVEEPVNWWWPGNVMGNDNRAASIQSDQSESESSVAPGRLIMRARVTVSFELK